MSEFNIIPITLKRCKEFISLHHRHNKPPTGHKFSIGLEDSHGNLVGVICAGRPIARHFDDGKTIEVNRSCTVGHKNANSMLYGAVWKCAKAMGYKRIITYTQADECGSSLRAVGWTKVKILKPRKSWAESTRNDELKSKRDSIGNGGVERVLWENKVQQYYGDENE